MSNADFWKTLNEMLRSDKLEFTTAKPAVYDGIMSKLRVQIGDDLIKAVLYALANPKAIAALEYEHNNGQPIKITENHLERAHQLIDSEICNEIVCNPSLVLNAGGDIPLDDFLLECHTWALKKSPPYDIVTDNRRKKLILTIFGLTESHELKEQDTFCQNVPQNKVSCTQVIFDTADVRSAIDQLIMNLSDRTRSLWRIQSVYVQESLRDQIHELLTTEKLNATNNLDGKIATAAEDHDKNQALVKKYGGKLVLNDNNTICLLFDVPIKYLDDIERSSFHQIPVVINFFRTTKEVIQLMGADFDAEKQHLTSIWTESIALFYEMAVAVESDVIWSNCIGLFDRNIPPMNHKLANTFTFNNRFETNFFGFDHKKLNWKNGDNEFFFL